MTCVCQTPGWRPDQGEAGALYWVAKRDWRQAAALGEPATDTLMAVLEHECPEARAVAIEALGRIGGPQALEALLGALKDPVLALAAAQALRRLDWTPDRGDAGAWYWVAKCDWRKAVALGAAAVEPLLAALQDADWDRRQAAAQALGKLGDARAVEPLIAALNDRHEFVRWNAAGALKRLGWKPDR